MHTKKYYVVSSNVAMLHDSYEDAVKEAKQDASNGSHDQYILQAIAVAHSPVPDVEVTTL